MSCISLPANRWSVCHGTGCNISPKHPLRNEAEKTHYDYIWNFMAWQLEGNKIKVDAAFFKSQLDLKHEREKWHREYELKRIALQNAVINFTPEIGQFAAIRDWRDGPIRIGKIENVILPNKRQAFSIDILEIKTDLTAGKRKINIWSKEKIMAIIQPQELKPRISKSELIILIEQNEKFDGLIWRMPQELWNGL